MIQAMDLVGTLRGIEGRGHVASSLTDDRDGPAKMTARVGTRGEPRVASRDGDPARSALDGDASHDAVRGGVDLDDVGAGGDGDPHGPGGRDRPGLGTHRDDGRRLLVAGSMRLTVPSRLFTTHTWPSAAAIDVGPFPTWMGASERACGWIDADHRARVEVADPDRTGTGRDARRGGDDRERLRLPWILRVDPIQGAVESVRHPDPALVRCDATRAVPDVDPVDLPVGRRAHAADRAFAAVGNPD